MVESSNEFHTNVIPHLLRNLPCPHAQTLDGSFVMQSCGGC